MSLCSKKNYVMKMYGEAKVLTLFILNLGTRWKSTVTSHLSPGNSPRYPLDRRLGKAQRRRDHYGEEKNLLYLQEIEPRFLGRPVVSRRCAG
jgi:hypothetical protein